MILEYKMDRSLEGRLYTPPWIEDGGYLFNPADFTYIGFSPSVREYKIPTTVTELTLAQAKARSVAIHAVTPYTNADGDTLTNAEVEAFVASIVSSNDIA